MTTENTEQTPQGIDIESTVADIASSLMPEEEDQSVDVGAKELDKETTTGDESSSPEPVKIAAAATANPDPADIAPSSWKQEAKDQWANLPPWAKDEIRRREQNILDQVKESQTPIEVANRFRDVLQPHMKMFQETNTDPWKNLEAMLNVQQHLLYGSPEQKLAIVEAFAKQAGLKFEENKFQHQGDATQQEIQQLRRRLQEMESGVTGVTKVVREARFNELQEQVRRFAEDKEAHPHFEEVADDITRLIQSGAAKDLQTAYDTACSVNPIVRQKVVDSEIAKRANATAKAEKERADKARAASKTRVRSTETRATPQPLGDIDDTLRSTLNEINSRTEARH